MLPMPSLVLLDGDKDTKTELTLVDLDTSLLAFGGSAACAIGTGLLCGSLLVHKMKVFTGRIDQDLPTR